MTIREQIDWLLDRIEDEDVMKLILSVVARIYAGKRY